MLFKTIFLLLSGRSVAALVSCYCFVVVNNRYCFRAKGIDLFTDTAAILNSIVFTEKLWAAEGAIAGKFIVYTAFRINFYCLSLIFHNKYYKRYIFPSRYLAVVPMVIEKLLLKVITPQYSS